MNESALHEEKFIEQYNKFFESLLLCKNIGKMRIFQVINLVNYTTRSTPFITESLLRKPILPAFKFLACNN